MFDFQKLDVYQKAKTFCKEISEVLKSKDFDRVTNDQLRRASFSIMLNIAEGSSRFIIPKDTGERRDGMIPSSKEIRYRIRGICRRFRDFLKFRFLLFV